MRITFLKETFKQLQVCLQKAYELGDLKNVRCISVLFMVAERQRIDKIILVWNVSRQTITKWIKAMMNEGFNCLKYERSNGRPAKLTKTQKDKIVHAGEKWPGSLYLLYGLPDKRLDPRFNP